MRHSADRAERARWATALAAMATAVMLAGAGASHAVPDVPDAPPVAVGWERPAGPLAWANDVNGAGVVVGMDAENRGAAWDSTTGAVRVLDAASGGGSLAPSAINDHGQVTGQIQGGQHAFRWSPDGTTIDLGTLAPGYSYGHAINDAGHVVGVSSAAPGLNVHHAFWWTPERGMVDLGTLPGTTLSVALDVNDDDLVVGMASPETGDRAPRAFAWTEATGMVDLGTLPGGTRTTAIAVNNHGEVVGDAVGADGVGHLFRWTSGGGMVDLGTAGYAVAAGDISDDGTIVGTWTWFTGEGPNGRAFRLTSAGGFEDLGVPTSDTGVSWGDAVNERGQVVGTTNEPDGTYRGFLWQAGARPETTPPTTTTTTTTAGTTTVTTTAAPTTVRVGRPTPVVATPAYTG